LKGHFAFAATVRTQHDAGESSISIPLFYDLNESYEWNTLTQHTLQYNYLKHFQVNYVKIQEKFKALPLLFIV